MLNENDIDFNANGPYRITNEVAKGFLGTDMISGNNLTTKISRLNNKSNRTSQEEETLAHLIEIKDKNRAKINTSKKIKASTGASGGKQSADGTNSNVYKTHKPTRPSDVTTNSLKISALPESLEKEIQLIKYLIEYFNNNNTNII